MNILERDIEKRVKEYARSKGWLAYKWVSPGHSFVPDGILISPSGKVIFVEFKQLGKKPSAGQEREHQRLRQSKVLVYVIDTVAKGQEMVDENS
jgi:hypothetical protein